MIVVFSLIGLMTVTPLAMELGKRAKVAEVETAVAH
jgi:hypothetical protein